MLGLFLNVYRSSIATTPASVKALLALFDEPRDDAHDQHQAISDAVSRMARRLGEQARSGGISLASTERLGGRVGAFALAAALQAPLLATVRHQAGTRAGLRDLEYGFFGPRRAVTEPRVLIFTDTYSEMNGVAGTLRRLAALGASGELRLRVVAAGVEPSRGVLAVQPDWSVPLPTSEHLSLSFPAPGELLARIEAERPEVIHVATPGPIGLLGLLGGKLLGLPVIGSYHTELGQYALHLTATCLLPRQRRSTSTGSTVSATSPYRRQRPSARSWPSEGCNG